MLGYYPDIKKVGKKKIDVEQISEYIYEDVIPDGILTNMEKQKSLPEWRYFTDRCLETSSEEVLEEFYLDFPCHVEKLPKLSKILKEVERLRQFW